MLRRIFNLSVICFVILMIFSMKYGYGEMIFAEENNFHGKEVWIVTENHKLAKKKMEQIKTMIDEQLVEIGDRAQSKEEREYLLYLGRKYNEQKKYTIPKQYRKN